MLRRNAQSETDTSKEAWQASTGTVTAAARWKRKSLAKSQATTDTNSLAKLKSALHVPDNLNLAPKLSQLQLQPKHQAAPSPVAKAAAAVPLRAARTLGRGVKTSISSIVNRRSTEDAPGADKPSANTSVAASFGRAGNNAKQQATDALKKVTRFWK